MDGVSETIFFSWPVGRSFFYNMFVLCWCVSVVVVLSVCLFLCFSDLY